MNRTGNIVIIPIPVLYDDKLDRAHQSVWEGDDDINIISGVGFLALNWLVSNIQL